MRSKVGAAEMASAAGIPAVISDGTARGTLRAAAAGEPVGHAVRGAPRADAVVQALAALREAGAGAGGRSTTARRGCCASRARSLLPVGVVGVEGEFDAGDAVDVVCDGELVGKGIVNYSAAELARIKGLKSAEVLELLPNASEEAVHRDRFVLT